MRSAARRIARMGEISVNARGPQPDEDGYSDDAQDEPRTDEC